MKMPMNDPKDLLLSSYDYVLDKKHIATYPINPKENAKLLVYIKNEDKIMHTHFKELSSLLPPCAIVFNDTKVIKARIFGYKTSGAKIELFLHQPSVNFTFLAQIRGKVKIGEELHFDLNLKAKVLELFNDGVRRVEFWQNDHLLNTLELYQILENIGHIPLPPYIKRSDENSDISDYQSIFARNEGAVAAPTASLHFSKEMIEKLAQNHNLHYLTLHVGAGTFKSVECENLEDHKMHSEYFDIGEETAKLIQSNIPLLGVGTTVTRCVEYFARTQIQNGFCDLFLHPYNLPIRQNYLLTNFHLPKSTLIMLVAAFIGREKTMQIYQEAIKNNYRFYSYGDAMLIL